MNDPWIEGPLRAGARRRCPLCDLDTDEAMCSKHGIATLRSDMSAHGPGASLKVGSVVGGRYVVKRLLGRGGFASVFEARHTGTGQSVALKMLLNGPETDDVALRRFFQEARVTSGLRHPNTIRVFDFGQEESGLVYLAMELLVGVTLKQELKRRGKTDRAFSQREAIDIGIAVTRSLGEAHAAGLVHRDLKPDNVFLHRVEDDDPAVKVLDFGIAKLANSSLTLRGVPGTPTFMSPEQAQRGFEVDGRSDLYSLGVVLYELVTGTVPFRGDNPMHTLFQIVSEPVPDVRDFARTRISDAFADVIMRALSKDPADRPQNAREMRGLLQACLDERDHIQSGSSAPVISVPALHAESAASPALMAPPMAVIGDETRSIPGGRSALAPVALPSSDEERDAEAFENRRGLEAPAGQLDEPTSERNVSLSNVPWLSLESSLHPTRRFVRSLALALLVFGSLAVGFFLKGVFDAPMMIEAPSSGPDETSLPASAPSEMAAPQGGRPSKVVDPHSAPTVSPAQAAEERERSSAFGMETLDHGRGTVRDLKESEVAPRRDPRRRPRPARERSVEPKIDDILDSKI